MSSAMLYRLSGIALLLGSLLLGIGTVISFVAGEAPASTLNAAGALCRLLGSMLLVLGLPGLYARQARRAGVLGLIGFVVITLFLLVAGIFAEGVLALVLPWLAAAAPALAQGPPPPGVLVAFMIGGLLGAIGGIVLGLATIRAAILPRWAGALILVGPLAQFIGNMLQLPFADVGLLIFVGGLAWLGLAVAAAPLQPPVAPADLSTSAARA